MTLSRRRGGRKPEGVAAATRFWHVEYYWREILLEEPDTCPWEFACKMMKSKLITKAELWATAEWADLVRQDVRRLRAAQLLRSIGAASKPI